MENIERKALIIFCALLVFCMSLCTVHGTSGGERKDRILFISSYSYEWNYAFEQIAGFEKVLKDQAIINYEFMDSVNVRYDDEYTQYRESLKYKLESRKKYDLVVVAGDAALDFARQYQHTLLGDSPVVFLGVNDLELADEAARSDDMTGLAQRIDWSRNFKLAEEMIPAADEFVFLVDDSLNAEGLKKQIALQKKLLQGYKIKYINSSHLSEAELRAELKEISDNQIVFYCIMSFSRNGNVYTSEECREMISSNVNVPVFRTFPAVSSDNIVGGYIVDYEKSSERAARIVRRILKGEKISLLPSDDETPGKYLFDQQVLDRFSLIIPSDIVDCQIIHKKATFMDRHQQDVIVALLMLLVIMVIGWIMILYASINRRKEDNHTLEEANEKLMAASNAKTDFLSKMSHEIRTPMNAIIGISSIGRDEAESPEMKEYFRDINSSGRYLLGILNDILDMNKIEKGKIELHEEVVNGPEFFDEIVKLISPMAQEKEITLDVNYSEAMTRWVRMDKMRSQQIYINLLSNAIKFSERGSTVKWHTRDIPQGEDRIHMISTVEDTGCGMSEEFQKKMFEPFNQERNSHSEEVKGTGLGLPIVKKLVEQMGGTVSVWSQLGKGSVFTVEMNRVICSSGKCGAPTEQSEDCRFESLRGKTVLLCEDHELNIKVTGKLLEKKGLVVDVAHNGVEGVEKFAASEGGYYGLIIMDIRMPVMNGLEAAEKIRKLAREDAEKVPIIAMTANAFDDDRELSRKAGMNAHISKPVNPEVLYATLLKYIEI